jgi:hypothetical protein
MAMATLQEVYHLLLRQTERLMSLIVDALRAIEPDDTTWNT